MTTLLSSTAQVNLDVEGPSGQPPALRAVVWVEGEHDICSAGRLVDALDRAVTEVETDVVVDLSQVTFMDAATVRVLIDCSHRLSGRSRALSLRSPSGCARRVLELCGLGGMIAPDGW